jgi:hypothetical protein
MSGFGLFPIVGVGGNGDMGQASEQGKHDESSNSCGRPWAENRPQFSSVVSVLSIPTL